MSNFKDSNNNNEPIIIFIEGNIASGKSTLTQLLADNIENSQAITEPLNEWQKMTDKDNKNILEYFYSDMNKYALPFQIFACISRIEKLEEIDKSKKYIFIERSIFSDKHIFAKNCKEIGLFNDIIWKLYLKLFSWIQNQLKINEDNINIIYLKSSPDISFERLQTRSRSEENEVSSEYLHAIHERHEEWLNNDRNNMLVLDANQSFKDDRNILFSYIDKITNKFN